MPASGQNKVIELLELSSLPVSCIEWAIFDEHARGCLAAATGKLPIWTLCNCLFNAGIFSSFNFCHAAKSFCNPEHDSANAFCAEGTGRMSADSTITKYRERSRFVGPIPGASSEPSA